MRGTAEDEVRRWRAFRWRLSRPAPDVGSAAAAGLPLPAAPAAYLSMLARLERFEPSDLDKLVFMERSLRILPLNRGGLALVPFEALPTLFAVHRFAWGSEVRRSKVARRKNEEFERAAVGLRARLERGPLRADAVGPADLKALEWLAKRGEVSITLEPASLFGTPVFFVPAPSDRIPPSTTYNFGFLEDAAQFYFRAAGPATRDDFLWWAGLSRSAARHSIEDLAGLLDEVDIEGERKAFFLLEEDAAELRQGRAPRTQRAALLPTEDPAGGGTRARFAPIVEPRLRPTLEPGGRTRPRRLGLLGGAAVGSWSFSPAGVELEYAKALSPEAEAAMRDEASRLSEFVETTLAHVAGAPRSSALFSRLL